MKFHSDANRDPERYFTSIGALWMSFRCISFSRVKQHYSCWGTLRHRNYMTVPHRWFPNTNTNVDPMPWIYHPGIYNPPNTNWGCTGTGTRELHHCICGASFSFFSPWLIKLVCVHASPIYLTIVVNGFPGSISVCPCYFVAKVINTIGNGYDLKVNNGTHRRIIYSQSNFTQRTCVLFTRWATCML